MPDPIIKRIQVEMALIDRLFVIYAELLEHAQNVDPNLVEVTALASVLHSFYTGVETIFQTIAKNIDGTIPTGARSHSELLAQMASSTQRRRAIVDADLEVRLANYLGFRHFYRHAYSYLLDWEELEGLVGDLDETWTHLKEHIEQLLQDLEQAGS